jgi:tRNA-Thr(GGU) m(6)t(6)A37 methyltransferase TsaA
MQIELNPIGTVKAGKAFAVDLKDEYAAGLLGLEGFSHVMIIWYAHKAPEWNPASLQVDKPYRSAPKKLGVFATRSENRPNGICVSVAAVSSIDKEKGVIHLCWTDAADGTPVLDIKPYHPCLERVRDTKLPEWCATWPTCCEDSATFPWEKEFLF